MVAPVVETNFNPTNIPVPKADNKPAVQDLPKPKEPSAPDLSQQKANHEAELANIKQMLLGAGKEIHFNVDNKTNQIVVELVDQDSGQVIQQIQTLKMPTGHIQPFEGMLFNGQS